MRIMIMSTKDARITPSEAPNYEFCPADVEILKKIKDSFKEKSI